MSLWDKIRGDAQKGLTDGINKLKIKASELSDEGRRKYQLFDLKSKVHREISDLGGLVYAMRGGKANPLDDDSVKEAIKRLESLEAGITALEGRAPTQAKKAPAPRKRAAPKKAALRRPSPKKSAPADPAK